MRLVFGLVLILGLGLAGFAVYLARGYLENNRLEQARLEAELAKIVPTKEVFVVTRQLKYGDTLTKEDLTIVAWPDTAIPEGVFLLPEEIFPPAATGPRYVTRTMEKHEALLRTKVTEPGQGIGISSKISPGMSAFTIPVDATSGVSGFLRPGDYIDIYWTGSVNNRNFSRRIETGVRLIAIDQSTNEEISEASIARTVTIEATPQQVARLAEAKQRGKLNLTLVGDIGSAPEIEGPIETDIGTILDIQPEAAVEEEKVCFRIERRGAETVKVEYECPTE